VPIEDIYERDKQIINLYSTDECLNVLRLNMDFCIKYYTKKRLIDRHYKDHSSLASFLKGCKTDLEEFPPDKKSFEELLRVPLEWLKNIPQRIEDLLTLKDLNAGIEEAKLHMAKDKIKSLIDEIDSEMDEYEKTMNAIRNLKLNPNLANTRKLLKEGELSVSTDDKEKVSKATVCLFTDCLAYKKGGIPIRLISVDDVAPVSRTSNAGNTKYPGISIQTGESTLYLYSITEEERDDWYLAVTQAWSKVIRLNNETADTEKRDIPASLQVKLKVLCNSVNNYFESLPEKFPQNE